MPAKPSITSRAAKVTRPCGSCGTLKTEYVSQVRGLVAYCNRTCKGLANRGKPAWNKGLTKVDHPGIVAIAEAKRGDKNPMRCPEVAEKSSLSHTGKNKQTDNYGSRIRLLQQSHQLIN